jgi:hypothetical protein
MSLKTRIIIGLADEEIGSRVANVVGAINASDDGKLGFFGAAATNQQAVTQTVTSLAAALINLGLASQQT